MTTGIREICALSDCGHQFVAYMTSDGAIFEKQEDAKQWRMSMQFFRETRQEILRMADKEDEA